MVSNRRTRFWINQGLANVHWWFTNVERGFGLAKHLQIFTILLFWLSNYKLSKRMVRKCQTWFWINQLFGESCLWLIQNHLCFRWLRLLVNQEPQVVSDPAVG